jgi:hypothetical protein
MRLPVMAPTSNLKDGVQIIVRVKPIFNTNGLTALYVIKIKVPSREEGTKEMRQSVS